MIRRTKLIAVNLSCDLATVTVKPPVAFVASVKTAERFFDFFAANIRRFSEWRADAGMAELSTPSVKLHLAVLRMAQQEANPTILGHAQCAGIETRIGNRIIRTAGIHDKHTRRICDRRNDVASIDGYTLMDTARWGFSDGLHLPFRRSAS